MKRRKTPSDVMSAETLSNGQERKLKLKKTETYVGASPLFDHDIYELDTSQQKQIIQVSKGTIVKNQLQKHHLRNEDEILDVISTFAKGKPVHVWLSNTLAQDLNLPMSTVLPPRHEVIQAFVLCVDHPPFVLMLHNKRNNPEDLDRYNRDTARLLHWSLLNFCHVDFTVLPCGLYISPEKTFTPEDLKQKLETRKSLVRRYFKSPLDLNDARANQMKAATTALVGATFVPSFLRLPGVSEPPSDSMCLFLMDEERRDKVSQQIELVKKKNALQRDLPLEQTDDLEITAVLEAAKRVSFTREVAVTGMTSAVESCLRDLKQYTKKCFGISLKLNTPGSKADYIINLSSSNASLPTSRTPVSETPTSGRKLPKTDMDVVRNGQPRLRPNPIRTTQSRALTAAPS